MTRAAACVWISLTLSIHIGAIQAAPPNKTALITLGAYDCLPVSKFGLANIRLWEPRASAIKKLGKPEKITQSKGEDDGGGYEVSSHHYRHFTVDFVRGVVDRIYTKHPDQKTPEGIRVGDSRAEVIRSESSVSIRLASERDHRCAAAGAEAVGVSTTLDQPTGHEN